MHNSILEFQQFETNITKLKLEFIMQGKEIRIQCIRMRNVSNYYVFISVEFFSIVANRKGALIPLNFFLQQQLKSKTNAFCKQCIRLFPFNSIFNWSTGHSKDRKHIVSAFLFCSYLRHHFRKKVFTKQEFYALIS